MAASAAVRQQPATVAISCCRGWVEDTGGWLQPGSPWPLAHQKRFWQPVGLTVDCSAGCAKTEPTAGTLRGCSRRRSCRIQSGGRYRDLQALCAWEKAGRTAELT